MRRILLLTSAVALVAAVIITTSLAARRSLPPPGSAAAQVSSTPAKPALAPARPELPRVAQNTAPETAPVASTPAKAPMAAPGSASMILVVDPETGRLGLPAGGQQALTIEELQSLARAEAEGLVTLRNPDGSETLNHEGRFADHSIARVGPDGKVTYGCVHGEGELDHALRATPPAKAAAEEK